MTEQEYEALPRLTKRWHACSGPATPVIGDSFWDGASDRHYELTEHGWRKLDPRIEAGASPPGASDSFILQLIALLEEGVTSAWCDAAIGCLPHVEPRRAAKFRDHFYDWQRRARAAIAKARKVEAAPPAEPLAAPKSACRSCCPNGPPTPSAPPPHKMQG